jgi:hypothetical protein
MAAPGEDRTAAPVHDYLATRKGWRDQPVKRRHVTVWIWGRGYRVSRLRLLRAALSTGDIYLHRWDKP